MLHTTGPDNQPLGSAEVAQISALAGQVGARIGTLRVFQQTQLQASTDGLTGLANRRTFENQARGLLLEGRPFALAMADLDNFKLLNDTYGHEAGDRALRQFAETLRGALRSDDLICRYGGEEFVLLFPGASLDQAAALLDRIRLALAAAGTTGDAPAFTATFGLTSTEMADSLDELLRISDRALYDGKHSGKDRVTIATATHLDDQPNHPDVSPHATVTEPPPKRDCPTNGVSGLTR